MKNSDYFVYILTNQTNTVFYIGVTNDLIKRVYEHKNKLIDGFTKKYNINKLVYYESFNSVYNAISREKQLKGGSRIRKKERIESTNPTYQDLYNQII